VADNYKHCQAQSEDKKTMLNQTDWNRKMVMEDMSSGEVALMLAWFGLGQYLGYENQRKIQVSILLWLCRYIESESK
jgi:hypothetical protein